MKRRFALLVGLAVVCWSFATGAMTLPAGASSWSTYAAQCDKWISDIPKLDSYIIQDNKDGNRSALTASIVAMYEDGKYIAACDNSPDAQLDVIARRWGAAIQNAAAYGYEWAKNESPNNTVNFVSAEDNAKTYENQFSDRLEALGR